MSVKLPDSWKKRREKRMTELKHIGRGFKMVLVDWEELPNKNKTSFGVIVFLGLIFSVIGWLIYSHWQSLVCVWLGVIIVFSMEASKLSKLKEKVV